MTLNRQEIQKLAQEITVTEALETIRDLQPCVDDARQEYEALDRYHQWLRDTISKLRDEYIFGSLSGDLGKTFARYGRDELVNKHPDVLKKLIAFLENKERFIQYETQLRDEIQKLAIHAEQKARESSD